MNTLFKTSCEEEHRHYVREKNIAFTKESKKVKRVVILTLEGAGISNILEEKSKGTSKQKINDKDEARDD